MRDVNANATLDAVAQALGDTFEGIAFAQILDQERLASAPDLQGDHFCAYIDLPDPIKLRFLLVMTGEHVTECFESVAPGVELPDDASPVWEDFIRELTNTAAGHFHTILAPEKDDMIIGLPEQVSREDIIAHVTPEPECAVLDFLVEEHHVMVAVSRAPSA